MNILAHDPGLLLIDIMAPLTRTQPLQSYIVQHADNIHWLYVTSFS